MFCDDCFSCEKRRLEKEECGGCGSFLCYRCYVCCQGCGCIECGCEKLEYCIGRCISPQRYSGQRKEYGDRPLPFLNNWKKLSQPTYWARHRIILEGDIYGRSGFNDGDPRRTIGVIEGNIAAKSVTTVMSASCCFLEKTLNPLSIKLLLTTTIQTKQNLIC